MQSSENTRLLSLLFGSGRALVNFKFLPGDNVTSAETLCDTAAEWLEEAMKQDGPNQIPGTGRPQIHYGELLTQG